MLKNDKGITLIEILIATAILSIVLVLFTTVQSFGLKQYNAQQTYTNNQSNVRYVVTLITQELRSVTSPNDVEIKNGMLTINSNIYTLDNKIIYKNDAPLVHDISSFEVTKNRNEIEIFIESTPNSVGKSASVSTKVILR